MRPLTAIAFAALIVCAALVGRAGTAGAQSEPQATSTTTIYLPLLRGRSSVQTDEQRAMASQVLALINAERALVGCGPLSIDEKLTAAAQGHSADMAANNFFDHTGSGGSDVSDRASSAGYSWGMVGENIAAGYSSPADVFAGWKTSAAHLQNIHNCAYTQTGIGYVYQQDDAPLAGHSWPFYRYWTQVFATPS